MLTTRSGTQQQPERREPYRFTLRCQPSYRLRCTPDTEWQRAYLEQLRYKWRYRRFDVRIIQALGDWGRAFGLLATVALLEWLLFHAR
jgi:hypothetical protein